MSFNKQKKKETLAAFHSQNLTKQRRNRSLTLEMQEYFSFLRDEQEELYVTIAPSSLVNKHDYGNGEVHLLQYVTTLRRNMWHVKPCLEQ